MEKIKVKITVKEFEVLRKASRGKIRPESEEVEIFKSLIDKNLLEHLGNNKYKTTKLGTMAVVKGEENMKDTEEIDEVKKVTKSGKQKVNDWDTLNKNYISKYKHYVPNSLSKEIDEKYHKRVAKVKCTANGCKNTREVFSSDIFQVKLCGDHRKKKMEEKLEKLKSR